MRSYLAFGVGTLSGFLSHLGLDRAVDWMAAESPDRQSLEAFVHYCVAPFLLPFAALCLAAVMWRAPRFGQALAFATGALLGAIIPDADRTLALAV
jgi:hypothetical protein